MVQTRSRTERLMMLTATLVGSAGLAAWVAASCFWANSSSVSLVAVRTASRDFASSKFHSICPSAAAVVIGSVYQKCPSATKLGSSSPLGFIFSNRRSPRCTSEGVPQPTRTANGSSRENILNMKRLLPETGVVGRVVQGSTVLSPGEGSTAVEKSQTLAFNLICNDTTN